MTPRKLSQNRRVAQVSKQADCFAYTDESGNSGLQLFGNDQDTFWTGTLTSLSDLDTKYKSFHKELLDAVEKKELHGNELGFGRIEKIAGRLAWFIREKKLQFCFVRVFKPYLATTKMFDLAFDSGHNPAVPNHAYGVRVLRLLNLLHFSQLLDADDLIEFWELFQAQDAPRFGVLLAKIRDRVKNTPYDARSIQILTESLDWASKHPTAVLDPFSEGDSPNFVAFTALFEYLHELHKEHGHTISRFVHDQQDQFVPHFNEAFDYLTKFHGTDHPYSFISDIEPIESFKCPMEVRSSTTSFGLQLVDLCMWFMKRVIEKDDEPRGDCIALFEALLERSYIKDYDFEMLIREVQAGADFAASADLSEEKLAEGKKILAQLEESRKKRLHESENGESNISKG